jgi:hypothetical protein
LTVYSNNTADAFRIVNVTYLKSGQVVFETIGATGSVIDIHASDDLVKWDLIPVQTRIGNTITINDSEAGARTRRFYRLADKIAP